MGTDQTGKHPSNGLPGKVQGARTALPKDADPAQILRIAQEAYERGIPAADVVKELDDGE